MYIGTQIESNFCKLLALNYFLEIFHFKTLRKSLVLLDFKDFN